MQERPSLTDPMDIERIIKEYYEQLFAHKFDNLDKNGKISWKKQYTKIHTRRNRYLNSPMFVKEINK